MTQVLNEKLADQFQEKDKKGRIKWEYDAADANELVTQILDESQKRIVAVMKEKNNGQPPRYKLVFQSNLGENKNQLIRFSSRCLWDPEHGGDACATATWTNSRIFIVITCFALYYE